jgi:hypothetical protein
MEQYVYVMMNAQSGIWRLFILALKSQRVTPQAPLLKCHAACYAKV